MPVGPMRWAMGDDQANGQCDDGVRLVRCDGAMGGVGVDDDDGWWVRCGGRRCGVMLAVRNVVGVRCMVPVVVNDGGPVAMA